MVRYKGRIVDEVLGFDVGDRVTRSIRTLSLVLRLLNECLVPPLLADDIRIQVLLVVFYFLFFLAQLIKFLVVVHEINLHSVKVFVLLVWVILHVDVEVLRVYDVRLGEASEVAIQLVSSFEVRLFNLVWIPHWLCVVSLVVKLNVLSSSSSTRHKIGDTSQLRLRIFFTTDLAS